MDVVEYGFRPFEQCLAIQVGLDALRSRSSRRYPSVRSISAIALETAGWDTASCTAAFAMLPVSATAISVSRSRSRRRRRMRHPSDSFQ